MNRKVIFTLILFISLFSIVLTGCNSLVKIPEAPTIEPNTGSITGKILDADGKPLLDIMGGDIGYVILMCPEDYKPRGECLSTADIDNGGSEIVTSICETLDRSSKCKLHLMLGASKVVANGSYIFPSVFPGKYNLLLIMISNGVAISIELINVDPVQAGKTVEYNFSTK
jgi:hypothetical protein